MVAIVIVLAAIAWIMVSGMVEGPDEEMITVTLERPDIEMQSRGATPTMVWDGTIEILDIAPDHKKVAWSELRILVKSQNGSLLQAVTNLTANDPPAYDSDDSDGISVQFWFVETTSGDTQMNAIDAIKLTGMGLSYEGASVDIMRKGEIIGSFSLPTWFGS